MLRLHKFLTAILGGGSFLTIMWSPSMAWAHRSIVTFDWLATSGRTCTNSQGTFTIGEEVSTQFQALGVVFSVNAFAIAYGSSTAITGSETGASGDPILAVNTIDDAINRCPMARVGNNGVLTATFVELVSGHPSTVANIAVHVSDFESTVHVRTLDMLGGILHECFNVFTSCPFVVQSTSSQGVDLRFPGGGIAKVEFIDEDATGFADGFTLDDLAFDVLEPSHVGSSVSAVSPTRVTCRNVTTREKVVIRNGARFWDCEAAGLVVNPQDIIQQTVKGPAD